MNVRYRQSICVVLTAVFAWIPQLAFTQEESQVRPGDRGTSSSIAPQVTGELGSPGATTTIGGKQLPPPDPKFGGVIKQKATESKPWWAPRVVPPKGAPNVLLIMTDDCGFGARERSGA